MGELQPKEKISSNRCPSPLTAVGLYHPAAGGDLDLRASLCAIHLVLQCWEWIQCVCVCFCLQQWTTACQAPGLAPQPNASVIVLQGKWGLCPSTAEHAKGRVGGRGGAGGVTMEVFTEGKA